MPDGRRVHDADSVRVLIELDSLVATLDYYCIRRIAEDASWYPSASDRHVRETGHRLTLGCCRRGEHTTGIGGDDVG